MATLTIPITVTQLLDLAKQLSHEERRALIDALLCERFDAVLANADRQRGQQAELTEDQIQSEIDAVRAKRQEDRTRAARG
jgi:hypothetical protein